VHVSKLKETFALQKIPQLGDDSLAGLLGKGSLVYKENCCEGYVNLPAFREPWGFVECVGGGGTLFVVGRCLWKKLFSCCGAMILEVTCFFASGS